MSLWERIKKDFGGNPRGYWFALTVILATVGFFVTLATFGATSVEVYWFTAVAVLLAIFFVADLALYYAFGEDYSLSASLRGRIAFATRRELVIGVAALLAGIWLSHVFQFGANPRRDDKQRKAYVKQLQDANSNLKRELKKELDKEK